MSSDPFSAIKEMHNSMCDIWPFPDLLIPPMICLAGKEEEYKKEILSRRDKIKGDNGFSDLKAGHIFELKDHCSSRQYMLPFLVQVYYVPDDKKFVAGRLLILDEKNAGENFGVRLWKRFNLKSVLDPESLIVFYEVDYLKKVQMQKLEGRETRFRLSFESAADIYPRYEGLKNKLEEMKGWVGFEAATSDGIENMFKNPTIKTRRMAYSPKKQASHPYPFPL